MPVNQTVYGAAGFGQLRNKSNNAKLSQYQGVHGTINFGPKQSIATPIPD